jgi:hypothetical protein
MIATHRNVIKFIKNILSYGVENVFFETTLFPHKKTIFEILNKLFTFWHCGVHCVQFKESVKKYF